jgi:hypothetical protein
MNDQWTARLSEYLDEELDVRERAALDAHLTSCAECRATLEALRRVVARAGQLSDAPPEVDLWPGIEAQLGPRGAVAPFWRRARHVRLSFTLPQAAAASLAIALLSVGLVWLARSRGAGETPPGTGEPAVAVPVVRASFADESYDRAVADLQRVLQEGRDRLDPKTYAAIEHSLETIDRAIGQARQALDADPANVYLNSHLAATRQRKLQLLRHATALAHAES